MRSIHLAKTALAVGVIASLLLGAERQISSVLAASLPSDDKAIVHVLNRIGFGPRPGDVEKVRAMGLQAYIDQQLHPTRIPDAAMEARLGGLTTLQLSSRDIAQQFEMPMLQARRDRKQDAKEADTTTPQVPNPMQQQANRVLVELGQQKMLRAAYSERQLQEELTDFWFNHFNVDARKGQDRFMLTEYERDAIRPHVLGKFRDLLEATAKSPAMLFYLDNWMSADPNGPHRDDRQMTPRFGQFGRGRGRLGQGGLIPARPAQQAKKNAPKGLNENYGR
jgi:uncharacterized protein (DUF1800 family)